LTPSKGVFTLKLKRHGNIIAAEFTNLKTKQVERVAYHSTLLDVADVSAEAFGLMEEVNLSSSSIVVSPANTSEAFQELSEWNLDKNFQGRTGDLQFGIRSVTINVTQICNLKCFYCAAGGDGTYGDPVVKISVDNTLPQLKFFISKLKPGQKFNISFVGGEPLLYPEALLMIYNYVLGLKSEFDFIPLFSLTTNATLINDEVRELLSKMKIHIAVSFDGPPEINNLNRPTKSKSGKSSSQMTLEGIQQLQKIKSSISSWGITAVVTDFKNTNLIQLYNYFKTFQPDWYEFNFSYTDANQESNEAYTQQMLDLAEYCYNWGGEKALRQIKAYDLYFKLLDDQQRVQNHCGAGKSYLMLDARNQIYTCPWEVGVEEEVVGKNQTLDMEKLQGYQKPLIELNNCQTCWAKYLCGGGCMYIHKAHTGDKHKKDEKFCYRTRGLILWAILYYKRCREQL
jgi:uncharacterized protein